MHFTVAPGEFSKTQLKGSDLTTYYHLRAQVGQWVPSITCQPTLYHYLPKTTARKYPLPETAPENLWWSFGEEVLTLPSESSNFASKSLELPTLPSQLSLRGRGESACKVYSWIQEADLLTDLSMGSGKELRKTGQG